MTGRRTLVSVDLDDVGCYHAIHGLPPPDPDHAGVVIERCLPRFLELFARLGVKATLFVIGRDVARDLERGGRGAALLRQAVIDGHELGNHGHAHGYDMVRWADEQIRDDLRGCDALLRDLGAEPTGFRAPGYTHDARLLSHVAQLGYAYDSSALPSLPYYVAKLTVMAAMAVRGRRSQSIASGMSSFVGRRTPFFAPGLGLWEFPMSVTPVLRLPLIGTTLLAGPAWLSSRLRRAAARANDLHLELHGIDLADPATDGYAAALMKRQPELQTPLDVRLRRLESLLREREQPRAIRTALAELSAAGTAGTRC